MSLGLAVTPGEPAGIGPDLLIKLIQQGHPRELIALSDPTLLEQRARILGLPLRLRDPSGAPLAPGELATIPIKFKANTIPGKLDINNATGVLACLERASQGCLNGEFAALITGPVHKGIINDAGIPFSGHTEYLADLTNTRRVVMMLATPGLRVALATTHVPLAAVAKTLTPELLEEVLIIVEQGIKASFAIAKPRILVCGLNPHAGEGGHIGTEELTVIEPVIKKLHKKGFSIDGPLPADTIFTPKYMEQADVIVAMYHDQGLPVLKYKGFGNAVNITLGLPFVRTSVDHGTALELAGTGKVDTGSLEAAISSAEQMVSALSKTDNPL